MTNRLFVEASILAVQEWFFSRLLDQGRFQGSMFMPIFSYTKAAFLSRELLPTFNGGYARADEVKLAGSQDLRRLLERQQLTGLFESDSVLAWLSEGISQDLTPALRRYLISELDIEVVTPRNALQRLDTTFLEGQSNEWICRLYEFLNSVRSAFQQVPDAPIIRLADGKHVPAGMDGEPQAFLPSASETGFPTVHSEACRSSDAKEFLKSIGFTDPDLVDDVMRNVLPRYKEEVGVSDAEYAADITRIVDAFQTDSDLRRKKLVSTLSRAIFVRAVDAGSGKSCWINPSKVYIKTDRLASLLKDVEGIFFLDQRHKCLLDEKVHRLLEACGASRYLRKLDVTCSLSKVELAKVRRLAGLERSTWEEPPQDCSLRGLREVFAHMEDLPPVERRNRAECLWEELVVVANRNPSVFVGTYKWGYSRREKKAQFDSEVLRMLRDTPWVPAGVESFRVPSEVSFESLKWRDDPLLRSKIRFRPPAIDRLAQEVNIEPDVLYLLKKHGITNLDAALERLGLSDGDREEGAEGDVGVATPARPSSEDGGTGQEPPDEGSPGTQTPGRTAETGVEERELGGARPFRSYVAVDREEQANDPDGLVHEKRMALEEAAIDRILQDEEGWKRTRTNNPGFDLIKVTEDNEPLTWCEVKAMRGTLDERPVGMSHTQFDFARDKGDRYWLYVVERAGRDDARIVRIQDPAGKARTFTFDKGWLDVANVN